MQKAKRGDTVHVHYTGKLDDGTVFDSSQGQEPIVFTIGQGQVIPGFEEAIEGMSTGEKKTKHIPAAEAYGEHDEDLVFVVPRNQLPPGSDVSVGDALQVGFPDGQNAVVHVAALDDQSVTLDANHELAGKDLTFDLELVKVE